MTVALNLIGKKFGTLVVLSRGPNTKNGSSTWLVHCDCGVERYMRGENLMSGNSTNCGCQRKYKTTHGKSETLEYILLHKAKIRAKRQNLPFNLELSDIVIPEFCPVLINLKLESNSGGDKKTKPNSPSLDKILPERGYIKGNVAIISHRANTIKQNATVEELRRVADWLEQELKCMATTLS